VPWGPEFFRKLFCPSGTVFQKSKEHTGETRNSCEIQNGQITAKGQITVPNEVRRALGVSAGDRLGFEERAGEMRIVPIRAESPFARYRGIGNPRIGYGKKAILEWLRAQRGHDHHR
jgi:AbrB family looped-hinge helix DNA binding protein